MTKVYPNHSTLCSTNYMTTKKERFTVWMKSLLFHGNGCTIFDSNGKIVYRIDNYEEKRSNKVHLMDFQGRILFSIQCKWQMSLLGYWTGYKWTGTNKSYNEPFFQVKRNWNFFSRSYDVSFGSDKAEQSWYGIVELSGKSSFNIVDRHRTIAEVRPKQSFSGVLLGDDVLSLEVEPQTDYSLVMALVAVYGMIKHNF